MPRIEWNHNIVEAAFRDATYATADAADTAIRRQFPNCAWEQTDINGRMVRTYYTTPADRDAANPDENVAHVILASGPGIPMSAKRR